MYIGKEWQWRKLRHETSSTHAVNENCVTYYLGISLMVQNILNGQKKKMDINFRKCIKN